MNRNELEKPTLRFALKIIEFVSTLPKNKTGEVIEFQLVKAGTSIGQTTGKQIELNREMTLFTS